MSRKTRKLMWSAPLVAVLAIAGALTMFMTAAPNGAQADHVDLPGAVSNLKVAAKSTAAVDLDWTAPSTGGAPTGYRIDISADGHTWMSVSADTGDASTAYRDGNIASFLGESRFYRVFALNEAGTGPVSRTAGPVTVPGSGAPGNVTGLIATATGPKSIRLTWTAPASTGGTDAITKYIIAGNKGNDPNISDTMGWEGRLPTDSNPDDDVVRFATPDAATSYELGGLMPNETWSFEVFAFNGEKVSVPPAPETRSATTGGLGKIGAVTGLTAVSQPVGFASDTPQIELYWYQPDDTGGRTIDDWKVERRERDGSGPWTEFKPVSGAGFNSGFDKPERSFDVADRTSDLDAAHTYQYRVTPMAETVMGEPSLSNVVKPYAYVDCRLDATREADQERRCMLSRAVLGEYGSSVKAERDGKGNVEITLTRNNDRSASRATSFRIDVSSDGEMWRPVEAYTGNLGGDAEVVYEYLDETTGGELYYRVLSYVGTQQLLPANIRPAKAALKPVGTPGKVQSLAARAVSSTQIDVTWSAPAQDGGANIDMYCVQISKDNKFDTPATDTEQAEDPQAQDEATTLCDVGTANGAADEFKLTSRTSYSHQGLMAGDPRYYKVYAINNPVVGGDNRSESSDKVSATTLKQDMPGMPAGLVAEAARDSNYGGRANSGVYLLWNKAQAPAGGEISGYTIQRKVDDGDWTVLEGNTENARTVYHDTSEPATDEQRIYRVAALNGDKKAGGWSDMAYYPAKVIVHDTALGAPTNVMATVDDSDPGSTSVTVTWTNGVNADRHIVVLFDANWEFHPSHIGTAQTDGMVTFENVQPGAYHAVVVSIEDNNQGNAVNFLYDIASVTVGAGN